MLETLLNRFGGRDVPNVAELSREMGVSPDVTVQMLMHLEKLGYVQRLATGDSSCRSRCGAHCTGCCGIEGASGPLRTWALTEKGSRRIERIRAEAVQSVGG